MNIWKKTAIIIIISVLCMISLSIMTLDYYINKDIQETELREASNLFDRIENNFEREKESNGLMGYSWAYWDETYNYVQQPNYAYIQDNLNQASLGDLNVSLIVLVNEAGESVLQYEYDTYNRSLSQLPTDTLDLILREPMLQDRSDSSHVECVMLLPSGPYIITAWSIMHSDSTGPSAGTLIFGKLIDSTVAADLSASCGVPISLSSVNGPLAGTEQRALDDMLNSSGQYITDADESTALCFGLIEDVNGRPAVMITTQMSREAYAQGMSSLSMMSIIIIVFGMVILNIVLLSMNKVVISRLTRLEDDVRRIGDGRSSMRMTQVSGKDEIHSLSAEINTLISSLDRQNKELQESEGRYKSIMEQSIGAILIVDPSSGSILKANRAFYKLFGYREEDLTNLQLSSIRPQNRQMLEAMLQRIQTEQFVVGAELVLQHQNGKEMTIELTGGMIEYEGRKAACITGWDVSERQQMEAANDKMEKLEAVGNLAGGIAHDFNNLLTGIMGNITLLREQLGPSSQARQRLDDTEVAATRAKEIAQGLLSLSKGGEPIRQSMELVELLRSWASFSMQGTNIECKFDLPSDTWSVNADPGQISRVFFNLFINARDAMPQGGVLEVTAKNCDRIPAASRGVTSGRYVQVEVKDTGNGIAPAILQKIFEPYFTTKTTGSGMGLYVAYATVKRHEGQIEVESTQGVGTTFRILLPASDAPTAPVPQANKVPVPLCLGNARVLIMDDQDAVLGVTSEILMELGYEVGMARDGQEALDMYKRSMDEGSKFSAVIMDLTIPQGMGGREAIRRLLEMDPSARAIVSSGYSTDPIMANPSAYGFIGVLPKPYRLDEVAQAVKKACSEELSSHAREEASDAPGA